MPRKITDAVRLLDRLEEVLEGAADENGIAVIGRSLSVGAMFMGGKARGLCGP